MLSSNTLILQKVLGQDSCPGQVRVGGATQERGAALPSVSPVPHINLPVLGPWKLELATNPREDLTVTLGALLHTMVVSSDRIFAARLYWE